MYPMQDRFPPESRRVGLGDGGGVPFYEGFCHTSLLSKGFVLQTCFVRGYHQNRSKGNQCSG